MFLVTYTRSLCCLTTLNAVIVALYINHESLYNTFVYCNLHEAQNKCSMSKLRGEIESVNKY